MLAALTSDLGMAPTYGQACAPCTLGDTYGAVIRLVFHDAFGGGRSGSGGPNGCIDFSYHGNKGLEAIVAALDASRAPFAAQISRADYWVLAATLAELANR